MTSLQINTPATGLNAVMSMSSSASFDKKMNTPKNNISYTVTPKASDRKSSFKLSSIDWDLNMNELEFE